MPDNWNLPPFIVEVTPYYPFTQTLDWGIADFKVNDLWAEFGGGEGVKVCVLDTGQPDHPDIIPALILAKDFTNSSRGVKDMNGHSTHCHGIIGARNNELATVGVAPKCELMSGKVLGDNGSGSSTGIVAGLRWAVANGADVISMSLGSPSPDPSILGAINQLPPNVVLCCAAGNSGPGPNTTEYPGTWDRCICVGSIKQARAVSQFSSRGEAVDIAAPGEKITSLWTSSQVAVLSGTSMATPYIAGVAALVIGYCRATGRPVPPHGVMQTMIEQSADAMSSEPPDPAYGFGIINPVRLMSLVKQIPVTTPTPPGTTPPPPPTPGLWEVIIRGVGPKPAILGPQ